MKVSINFRRKTLPKSLFAPSRWRILTTCLLFGSLASPVQWAHAQIKEVPLPDPQIPNYHFPERESTILNWIHEFDYPTGTTIPQMEESRKEALNKIALHGWGLWTALTSETDQVIEGQKLRVFETWYSPQELNSPTAQSMTKIGAQARGRSRLQALRQFSHSASKKSAGEPGKDTPGIRATGFVKYSPAATEHIVEQQLLAKATLDSLLTNGANAMAPFPSRAVSLKPVFETITRSMLKDGRYYPLRVWTGPPTPPMPYPEEQWPGIVWIDIQVGGTGKYAIDMQAGANPDGSTRTEATTYPVANLINFRLNAADAANLNNDPFSGVTDAAAGDYSILVAMHVTSKEVTRWTWQTFWWTPDPDNATLPSSSQVVTARPAQLQGAPRNYAMSLGYEMESPSQPYVGGSNVGESAYAYNPYLEAGFGPGPDRFGRGTLPDSKPGLSKGQVVANTFGVQTSCMSCHANANYSSNPNPMAPSYTGDQYIDLNSPRFSSVLKVDFLWSIPGNAK